jgi:hypothetical protein
MGDTKELLKLIESVGFPAVIAIAIGVCFWFTIKWMMKSLTEKLDKQFGMIVKLIDRIRILDNDIIRLETMIRILKDLPPDWERIGKRNPEDIRKD